MRRTIENGFELTGPIQRGDWETVERHLEAIRGSAPSWRPSTERSRCNGGRLMRVCRTIAELRTALEPCRAGTIGLVPTMGALHAGHLALLAAARAECSTVVMSLFVNPAQFAEPSDLGSYPRSEEHDLAVATEAGVDLVFAPPSTRCTRPGSRPGSK